jgi:hypothetical protein
MFFEEYVNFQNHYLSRRVIPLQRGSGSQIRPQPYGLGLNLKQGKKNVNINGI